MYKTPTLTSKISPFYCAPHDPMPNPLIDTRVQTRRDYTPDYVIYWQFLLVAYRDCKYKGRKIDSEESCCIAPGVFIWFVVLLPFPFVLFYISPVLHNLSGTCVVVEKEKPFNEIW